MVQQTQTRRVVESKTHLYRDVVQAILQKEPAQSLTPRMSYVSARPPDGLLFLSGGLAPVSRSGAAGQMVRSDTFAFR